MDKVYPYKEILPKELYRGLLETYLSLVDPDSRPIKSHIPRETNLMTTDPPKETNPRTTDPPKETNPRTTDPPKETNPKTTDSPRTTRRINIDSRIITYQHAEVISKWVDKLKTTDEAKKFYEFKLLYRGSRDGFTSQDFHDICDNQSHTVTFVKVDDSSEILGGYNPIEWKSDKSWGNTKNSFIFSFESKSKVENCVLSRVAYARNAVYNYIYNGPTFDKDLKIYTSYSGDSGGSYCEYSEDSAYKEPIRAKNGNFYIEECEVFRLYKNDTNLK